MRVCRNGPWLRLTLHTLFVTGSLITMCIQGMPTTKKFFNCILFDLWIWNWCKFFLSHYHHHTLPLPPRSHTLPHLPGTHSHISGLHTASWCLACWRDTSHRLTADTCPAPFCFRPTPKTVPDVMEAFGAKRQERAACMMYYTPAEKLKNKAGGRVAKRKI